MREKHFTDFPFAATLILLFLLSSENVSMHPEPSAFVCVVAHVKAHVIEIQREKFFIKKVFLVFSSSRMMRMAHSVFMLGS